MGAKSDNFCLFSAYLGVFCPDLWMKYRIFISIVDISANLENIDKISNWLEFGISNKARRLPSLVSSNSAPCLWVSHCFFCFQLSALPLIFCHRLCQWILTEQWLGWMNLVDWHLSACHDIRDCPPRKYSPTFPPIAFYQKLYPFQLFLCIEHLFRMISILQKCLFTLVSTSY